MDRDRLPMRTIRWAGILALVALCGTVLTTSTAQAGLVSSISGNSRAIGSTSTSTKGTMNFAVFDKTGGDASDPFGVGSTDFYSAFSEGSGSGDLTALKGAAYLYLYQVVNDATSSPTILDFIVDLNGYKSADLTAWGFFAKDFDSDSTVEKFGLQDKVGGADTEVGTGNQFGADGIAHTQVAPANLGVTATPPVVDITTSPGGGVAPTIVEILLGSPGDEFSVRFSGGQLAAGGRSVIMGFASNVPYGLGAATLKDSLKPEAFGTVATLAPEASGFILSTLPLLFGSVILIRAGTRRRTTV